MKTGFVLSVILSLCGQYVFAEDPLPVTVGSDQFPGEIAFGQVLSIQPPKGVDIYEPKHWLVLEADSGAVVWIGVLPKEYCPNLVIFPVHLKELPKDGKLPAGRYHWKVTWRENTGDLYDSKAWKDHKTYQVEVVVKEALDLPQKKVVLAEGAEKAELSLKPGEVFLLENPTGAWTGCYLPPGGGDTSGRMEAEFKGFLLAAFAKEGATNIQDGKKSTFGFFDLKK